MITILTDLYTLRNEVGISSQQDNFLFNQVTEKYVSEAKLAQKKNHTLYLTDRLWHKKGGVVIF